MTTVTGTPRAGGFPPDLRRAALSGRRRVVDGIATALMWLAVVVAAVPLAVIVSYVVARGAEVMSWEFITGERITRLETRFGGSMGPAVVGTLVTTGLAAAIAIPLGVLGAVYLSEYGKNSALARTLRMLADIMTGVPSVVMGLFIYITVVIPYERKTALAGALALACLILPVVLRSAEEMLKLVPDELREASLARGARKWRTTVTVVLPAAVSGITSGSLLAIARAAGETAPILLVMGSANTTRWDLFRENTSLPAEIFRNANSTSEAVQQRGWGAALTLIIIVLSTTLIARFISSRFAIKER